MRLIWLVMLFGGAGCTMNNPAFMASAGDDGSSGDGGGSGSAGSTTGPDGSTGEPPSMTTATPSTSSSTDGPEPVTSTAPATTDPGDTTSTSTSTGVDPNETTGPDASTGDVVPVCGNGIPEGDEQCDDAQNEPAIDKCSPDCQAVILKKQIFAFNAMIKGGFMDLVVADAACKEAASDLGLDGDFKALISDGDTRIGSVQAWDGQASPDWPLHAYRAYFNTDDQLVWMTLKRPLLGAGFDNEGFALPHPIQPGSNYAVWTGLQSNWVSGPNCDQWSGGMKEAIAGKPYKLEGYIDAAGYQACEIPWGLICVQQ